MGDEADRLIEQMWDYDPYLNGYGGRRYCSNRTLTIPAKPAQPKEVFDPTVCVAKTVSCSFCHKPGLHWGKDKGNNRLREECGVLHDCGRSQIEINLPNLSK